MVHGVVLVAGAVALLLAGVGALNLLVVRHAPELLDRTRALLRVDAAVVLALLTISLTLFPPAPRPVAGSGGGGHRRRAAPPGRPGDRGTTSVLHRAAGAEPPDAGAPVDEAGADEVLRTAGTQGRSTSTIPGCSPTSSPPPSAGTPPSAGPTGPR